MTTADVSKLKAYAEQARRVELKPLTTPVEAAALDIARYRAHVANLTQLDRGTRECMQKVQELDGQRQQYLQQAHDMRDGVLLFVAEAREQAGILISKHGLTQEEVNALAPVPEGIGAVRLDALVPERLRPAKPAPGPAAAAGET